MLTHRHEQAHILRNVVHDLRTPLGNIEICAYLLGRKLGAAADDEVREYIEAIQRQVAAADRILQDATAEAQQMRTQTAEASFSLTNVATAGVT